jgi:CheY-like chemotaxis protein/DNA-directed RNA polymerase specialized sigma24 family protein
MNAATSPRAGHSGAATAAGPIARAIAHQLPFLRRYARALLGDQAAGDAAVRRALASLFAQRGGWDESSPRIALFRAVGRACRPQRPCVPEPGDGVLANSSILASRLGEIDGRRRQVLVLTSLEGFALADAAEVMEVTPTDAQLLLLEAKADLRAQRATDILIIEDEPVIALDIAGTVSREGHRVVGIAATRAEAVAMARERAPGLILADINLADGSSGLDAVQEILAVAKVPVIFITAYPERLLTGERPEPTFLITKPFDPDTLAVSISQALVTAPF